MQLKMPWIDTKKCARELDCKAARLCKQAAMEVAAESADEPGKAARCPMIDFEKCKRCGECEATCPERAITMI